MKKYLNFFICAIIIALFSCSKDDDIIEKREVYVWGYTLSIPPDGKQDLDIVTFLFFDGKYADEFTPKTYYAPENKTLYDYINTPLDTVYRTLFEEEKLLLDNGMLASPEYTLTSSTTTPSKSFHLLPGDYFVVAFYGVDGRTMSEYKNKYACKRITIDEDKYVFFPITVVFPRWYTIYGNITWINAGSKVPDL